MRQQDYRGTRSVQNSHEDDYEQRKKEAHKRFMKKKRKRKRIKRVLISLCLILSVLLGYVAAQIELTVNKVLDTRAEATEGDLNNVDLSDINVIGDDQVINVLLVGSDKRASQTDKGRSDSTMIATVDMKNNQLKLTSLMRDMYVSIPGYESNRFNAAYSYGGVPLLYQTIATNFGVRLDGYVVVDFEAFENVINQIGGVEVTVTESEYKHLQSYYKNKKGYKDALKITAGKNVMNGKQALCYARIRKEGNGDFRRTERQRIVLQAIFTKAKSLSINELINMMTNVLPYISTDLTNDEIMSYMKSILMMGTTQINQFRIPAEGTYTDETIRSMKVLVPDIPENAAKLQDFIFNKATSVEYK
ncbi:MAG: LCP family protein [bacterium]|nr:LCP family protein [bacterium]